MVKISIDVSFDKKGFKDLIGYKDDVKVKPSNSVNTKKAILLMPIGIINISWRTLRTRNGSLNPLSKITYSD